MEGSQKVATLLLALDPKVAAGLLARFAEQEKAEIVENMLAMDYVDDATARSVLAEFGQLWGEERHGVTEPRSRARAILENALGGDQVERYLGEHDRRAADTNPFATLDRIEPGQLASLLGEEHPQTIALVLARMDPMKAGQTLARLPQETAADVVRRMVSSDQSAPALVLQRVGQVLNERAQALAKSDPLATPQRRFEWVAKILSAAPRGTRDASLSCVREQDAGAGEQLRNLMFLFDDLPLLAAEALRKVVGALDTQTIALALKTASEEVKQAVFSAMSKRAAQSLREEQALLGPRPLADVEDAQQKFVDTVVRLREAGEIAFSRAGTGVREELV